MLVTLAAAVASASYDDIDTSVLSPLLRAHRLPSDYAVRDAKTGQPIWRVAPSDMDPADGP
jgi:hypothetical protein